MRSPLLFFLTLSVFSAAYGDVTLPPLISDNMLLQKGNAVVWGKADRGEKITVKLGKSSAHATANKDGKWRVKLGNLSTGIAGDMTIAGNNSIVVKNVAVGDVWFCSGQSNMEFVVARALNAQEEIAAADFPAIRMFTVEKNASDTPLEDVAGKWELCSPQTVPNWSAVAYFFGRQLYKDLGMPVGLINASWAGTPAQSWTPQAVLQANADLDKTYNGPWKVRLASYPELLEKYHNTTLPAWQIAADAAKAAGNPIPPKPKAPEGPNSPYAPGDLYNGMIAGATAYPIKGVIWYQGESNVADPDHYRMLLPAMVESWRKAWGIGDSPFLMVQLANFLPRRQAPADSRWAALRESQRLVSLSLKNCAMAAALDIGDAANMHPQNKQEVGRRLALMAEAKAYDKGLISTGPQFDKATFEGNCVTVSFKPGTALGLMTRDGEAIKGMAVAGEDRKFAWAEAQIVIPSGKGSGKSAKKTKSHAKSADLEPVLVIKSEAVAKPVAVRYAWADNPDANLINKAGLPAPGFRTDDWPQNPPSFAVAPAAQASPAAVASPSPAP